MDNLIEQSLAELLLAQLSYKYFHQSLVSPKYD